MKNSILLIAIILLSACSGESTTTKTIRNLSDSEIRMLLYRGGGTLGDTLIILSGENQRISIGTSSSGTDEAPDCADRVDSAYARVIGGGTLTKKIQRSQNWEVETNQTGTLPPEYEHECTFTIRNSDIE